jgi:hypothetical protein
VTLEAPDPQFRMHSMPCGHVPCLTHAGSSPQGTPAGCRGCTHAIPRDQASPSALAFGPMPRTYVPHTKHKWPKGYGSLCPAMPEAEPGTLLDKAIAVPGVGEDSKLWFAIGRWCFCAHRSPHAGPDAWHGFPVIGGDVDERVLRALRDQEYITRREMRQLRAQRELPEEWP